MNAMGRQTAEKITVKSQVRKPINFYFPHLPFNACDDCCCSLRCQLPSIQLIYFSNLIFDIASSLDINQVMCIAWLWVKWKSLIALECVCTWSWCNFCIHKQHLSISIVSDRPTTRLDEDDNGVRVWRSFIAHSTDHHKKWKREII